jgi:hypothetical protein
VNMLTDKLLCLAREERSDPINHTQWLSGEREGFISRKDAGLRMFRNHYRCVMNLQCLANA